jgi:hypothetical protein
MNNFQKLWWQQARSDLAVLALLRRHDICPCHQLHYLQMVTEKLAQAYFWRSKSPPVGALAEAVSKTARRYGKSERQIDCVRNLRCDLAIAPFIFRGCAKAHLRFLIL